MYGRLSAAQILALLPRLCEGETEEDTAMLLAVAQCLAGTEAELYLAAKFDRPEPRTGAALLNGRLLLSKSDYNALLAFIHTAIRAVTRTIRDDARRIAAALKPSAMPRLLDRRYSHWRLFADEYDHPNWLDASAPEELARVQDAILNRGARYCPILVRVASIRNSDIESSGLITDLLRIPGEPSRRWLDLQVLSDVTREVRALYQNAA